MTENNYGKNTRNAKKLFDIDLTKYFKSDKITCMKCNTDIGELGVSIENCPKCGYSTDESVVLWMMKNSKFSLRGIINFDRKSFY